MRLLAPARRVNMGTADEFALDIMINALDTLSRECAPWARLFRTCLHAQRFAGAVRCSFSLPLSLPAGWRAGRSGYASSSSAASTQTGPCRSG